MKRDTQAVLLAAGCGLALAVLALGPFGGGLGPLLLALSCWVALLQGCVAVAATCDLVKARWIGPIRSRLLAPTPLLLLSAPLFLLFWPQLQHYPWSAGGGRYLHPEFFMLRNLAALLLTAVVALAYAAAASRKQLLAVVYLLLFVVCQSLIAFDWIMSLEYPWYSSMLGFYFITEALYAGLAVACLLFWRRLRAADPADAQARERLRDLTSLIFGFCILWGGLFFAQYLLIWYGNLPEETGFILRRTGTAPYRQMAWLMLGCTFMIPFLGLLSARVKSSPAAAAGISLVILGGLLLERLLYILPVLTLAPLATLAQFFLLGAPVLFAWRRRAAGGAGES
ncbi:MAG TPA: hypothetical protein VGA63_00615 [Geopsychrobacteraceae bacterium]|jgi:hypothetical protein